MNRYLIAAIVTIAALSSGGGMPAGFANEETSALRPSKVLRVRLPRDIATDKVTMLCGLYGNESTIQEIRMESGVYEYPLDLRDAALVRLRIYSPGHRMIAADFNAGDILPSAVFSPRFEPLPTVPLRLKLADTAGKPVAGQKLSLSIRLDSHRLFGAIANHALQVIIATGTTSASGECTMSVPSLLDDPFFAESEHPMSFMPDVVTESGAGRDRDIIASTIEAQKTYPEPFALTLMKRAKLTGRIEKSFLDRNKIEGETRLATATTDKPYWIELRAMRQGSWSNCTLLKDGTFSVMLPPDAYDLVLYAMEKHGQGQKEFPIQKDIVLEENEHRVVNVE